MIISENSNMYGNVTVTKAEGAVVTILSLNANFDVARKSMNISCNLVDAALVETNKSDIQPQIDEFLEQVRAKMLTLGYSVTL